MCDSDDDALGEAQAELLGEAEEFDPVTGMPVARHAARDGPEPDAMDVDELRALEASSGAAAGTSAIEPWTRSLAEKNAHNTHDLKVPHMLGIDEAGRGPVLGQ